MTTCTRSSTARHTTHTSPGAEMAISAPGDGGVLVVLEGIYRARSMKEATGRVGA